MELRKYTDVRSMINNIISEPRNILLSSDNPIHRMIGFTSDEVSWEIGLVDLKNSNEPIKRLFSKREMRQFLAQFMLITSKTDQVHTFWESIDMLVIMTT